MPPRQKPFDAVCLIIDVGATAVASGYLDRAISCASEMVQRKVYAEADDVYGIILVGTRRSDNNLNYPHISLAKTTEGLMARADFRLLEYIEKNIKQMAGPEVENGDWMDAVIVAMDHIHRSTESSMAVRNKRIIMLTDMGCPASDNKLQTVLDVIKREDIEFTFLLPDDWMERMNSADDSGIDDDGLKGKPEDYIGEDDKLKGEPSKNGNHEAKGSEKENNVDKPKSKTQEAGTVLMERVFAASPGAESCGIGMAQELLFNKERKKKTSMAWKVDLEIGPDIRIPITGYVAMRREAAKSWKRCLAKPDNVARMEIMEKWRMESDGELKAETTFVRNNEDQQVVENDNLIDAFKYGSKVCPLSEVEKSAGKFEAGPKSLMVVGFVKRAEIPVNLLLGDGCMMFQPTMDSTYSITALSSLVEALVREEMVVIVRRVYNRSSAPKLAALIPEDSINDEGEDLIRSLVYIELPYAEDLRNYQFPPLWAAGDEDKASSKHNPSEEQLQAVDKLIDCMMLNNSVDSDGRNDITRTDLLLNPYYQHLYRCLTSRSLNPARGRPLPKVESRIREIMETPPTLANAAGKPLSSIAKLFKLETVVKTKEKQTADKAFGSVDKKEAARNGDDEASNMEGIEPSKRLKLNEDSVDLALNEESLGSSNVTEVGTTTPVEDFERLLQAGFHIGTVSMQMERIILNFLKVSFGDQMNEKIITCLETYRHACVELKSPTVYNKFARELKTILVGSGPNKRDTIWQQIVQRKIGLIDSTICDVATDVSPEESKAFLAISMNVKSSADKDNGVQKTENAEDLLDDL